MATVAASPIRSVRERNRYELTRTIVAEARRQLATQGAAGLSLRSVSRELGMASSAIYRYVASRDELLTLLIVDAYDALGAAVERAVARVASRGPEERFRAFATALRRWALAHPHEYALLYGSPVPGYRGTDQTTRAAARTTTVLAGLLRDATSSAAAATAPGTGTATGTVTAAAGSAAGSADPEPPRILWPELARLLATPVFAEADGTPATIPRPVLVRGLMAWVELFGLISFELFGQFAHAIERPEQLYLHAVDVMIADLF